MQVSLGREKAKRNIVIFVIGALLLFLATVLTEIAEVANVDWLNFFFLAAIVGIVLQIIAIILLRNVNKYYANSLWALIFNVIFIITIFVLSLVAATQKEPATLLKVSDGFGIATSVMEAFVVIFFVKGTNQLAEEDGKGMPILTKIIVRSYIAIFLLSIVLRLIGFIPAIGENGTVVMVFNIIILALFVIREVAYLFFLIKSLWTVK